MPRLRREGRAGDSGAVEFGALRDRLAQSRRDRRDFLILFFGAARWVGRGSLRCRVGDGDEISLDIGFGAGGVVKKLQNIEKFVEDARWNS